MTAFDQPRTGVFTAWFSTTPSIAPTNSVVGLSDGDVGSGDTPLHNLHQILIRFAASGTLDARNGATYSADTVIKSGHPVRLPSGRGLVRPPGRAGGVGQDDRLRLHHASELI